MIGKGNQGSRAEASGQQRLSTAPRSSPQDANPIQPNIYHKCASLTRLLCRRTWYAYIYEFPVVRAEPRDRHPVEAEAAHDEVVRAHYPVMLLTAAQAIRDEGLSAHL